MSVVVEEQTTGNLNLYIKGSPEMIHSLSLEYTIPDDYFDVLEKYTKDGLRVLALAFKWLKDLPQTKIKTAKREELEFDLVFIGFLIMENSIKPETKSCIESLKHAEISTIMATGDNGLTAVSVGRHWGIINASKLVYLAELVSDKQHIKSVKWMKVEVSKPILLKEPNSSRRISLSRAQSKERRKTLSRLSHVSGFDEFKHGKVSLKFFRRKTRRSWARTNWDDRRGSLGKRWRYHQELWNSYHWKGIWVYDKAKEWWVRQFRRYYQLKNNKAR